MKLIVAGSRHFDEDEVYAEIVKWRLKNIYLTEIVSGGCRGVDKAGEGYADFYSLPMKQFLAEWDKHGKAAGPIRNKQMAKYADGLLLIWNGKSRGSASMKREMEQLKKPVYEIIIKEENEIPSNNL